jgi:hypothetical protein
METNMKTHKRNGGQHGKRILKVVVKQVEDSDPNVSYLEQDGFEDRLQAYRNGLFGYVGVVAHATVQLGGDLTQQVHSGGLWGIESDSDGSYLAEVAKAELGELRKELHVIGFSKRAIAASFRGVELGAYNPTEKRREGRI